MLSTKEGYQMTINIESLIKRGCPGCGKPVERWIGAHPWCANELDRDLQEVGCATIGPHFHKGGKCLMANRRDGPYVWVTWLSKLMAGETSCEWAPWFRTHYRDHEKVPSDFDQAAWQMEHTRALRDLRVARQAAGEEVTVERQNYFQWERPNSPLVLAGTPDLICVGPDYVRVYDVKTGMPRTSHQTQVMIYMHCLRSLAPVYRDKLLHGAVTYADGNQIDIPLSAIDDRFVENFDYYLDILESPDPAEKIPSEGECRFCDIARSECPERIEAEV